MKSAFLMTPLLALSLAVTAGCARHDTASNDQADSLLSVSEGEAMVHDAGDQGTDTRGTAATPTRSTSTRSTSRSSGSNQPRSTERVASGPRVTAGTPVTVSLNTEISSKTANVGDSWSGTVTNDVVGSNGEVVIPAGSTVSGVVTAARAAERGDRAMLDIGVRSVTVNGRRTSVNAGTEAVVAGSTRARNLGAIAGGAAAGALLGKAIGGKGKDAVIGGAIGAAAAGGAVAASKGYQVVLKDGMELTFTVSETVAMR